MTSVEIFVFKEWFHCQSGAGELVVAYYCSVELVKVFSYWLSSKFELHITYQFLVLLFHYFRTNFSPTWKNYTMKCIVNMHDHSDNAIDVKKIADEVIDPLIQTPFFRKPEDT